MAHKGRREIFRADGVHLPITAVMRNGLQVAKSGQHRGCRFCAPSWQPGKAVGCVAYQPQVIRNGFRTNTKFLNDCALVIDRAGSTIELDDTCASYALGEILIRSADDDALNRRILRSRGCGRSQSIVRLKFHHRPHNDPGCRQHILKERKLSQKVGINSFAGFVSCPQRISKRFDYMVRRYPDVGDASFQHAQQRGEHTPHRTYLAPFSVACARQRVEVAKKLVCAVDQVYFHDRSNGICRRRPFQRNSPRFT